MARGQALVAPGNDGRAGDDNKRGSGDGKEIEPSLAERYEVQRAAIHCDGPIWHGMQGCLVCEYRI